MAIRWASEMGLARIVPILTRRCTVRIPLGEGAAGKLERWRRIARESAEQCRRSVPLAVDAPCDFNALLARSALFEARWIAVPGGLDFEASGLLEALGSRGGELLVVVGPEGGFDPEEIAAAQGSGLRPLGFPTPVLRTPTAVAYLAALASMAPWVQPS